MRFDELFAAIDKNSFKTSCPPKFTQAVKEKNTLMNPETQWSSVKRPLDPPRLTTAWLCSEDPLMLIAGPGYRATEVRNRSFALQEEALSLLRGNRKLTKAKMADALNSLKPTEDQTKVLARILLALKHYQTVCYNEKDKTVWTMPEDLRAWSTSLRTIWIDSRSESYLDFSESAPLHMGKWLSDRENEGWKIEWPIAEDSYEEMKGIALERGLTVRPMEGTKAKKDDYARVLGRTYAIEHLG
jgi:hypothetical protein